MCEELNRELKRGETAAKGLAEHVVAMGAGGFERTIAVDGVLIKITASVVSRV